MGNGKQAARVEQMSGDKLKTYRDRRDFRRSPEPSGKDARKPASRPIFVIQKHDASRLHYDFRLEMDGVLKSWAVPKGPSMDPREKRLAVQTEDHPLDYADFEGVIPEEEYGGGTVLVWDAGTWKNRSKDKNGRAMAPLRALEAGKLVFELWGKKLRGQWSLIRMDSGETKSEWLLIKNRDDYADARRNPVSTEPLSVISERDLKAIQKAADSEDS